MNGSIFDPENSRISLILSPSKENPRSSEGDFLRLKDGRILFAYSYYHGEDGRDDARCDIRCLWSDDEGVSFHTGEGDGDLPHLLVDAADFGEKNVMSVSLLRMENGDAGLICILKHVADGSDECLLFRTADEFATFYETVSILPGEWKGYYVLNNCRVERLRDGRLLAPVARHEIAYAPKSGYDGRSGVWFFASDDDGRTWKRQYGRIEAPVLSYTDTGLQEPGVIELPNGVLYAYMRTDLGCQYESVSLDGGDHWSAAQPSRFTSPQSPMKIARNPYTGIYYAVWNPIPNYLGRKSDARIWGRTPLAIAKSTDGYRFDFRAMQYLEDDPDRGFSYPAIFFPDAKTMLCAYCSGSVADGCNLFRLTIRRVILND